MIMSGPLHKGIPLTDAGCDDPNCWCRGVLDVNSQAVQDALRVNSPTRHDAAYNHPDHYGGKENPYEVIKVIEAWKLDFCLGNGVKYISRAAKKDPTKEIEDLEKSIWYIRRRIEQLQGEQQDRAAKATVADRIQHVSV